MIMNLEYSDFQLPSGTRRKAVTQEIRDSRVDPCGGRTKITLVPVLKSSLELHKHLTGLNLGLK